MVESLKELMVTEQGALIAQISDETRRIPVIVEKAIFDGVMEAQGLVLLIGPESKKGAIARIVKVDDRKILETLNPRRVY